VNDKLGAEKKEELKKNEKEKSKSIGRPSKFALAADHDYLKKMISQRENAL
jgi:hypothetical protein